MDTFRDLTLEITTHCQGNCIVCVRDKIRYKLGNMTQQLFEKAVTEADELYAKYGGGVEFVDLGGMGEPLLDAQIEEKLKWLDMHYPNIQVGLTTNGQLLMNKKEVICKYVDILKISNYGFTKQSFEKVHRGSLIFENVKDNIETFLSIPSKCRPKTIMSFLVLRENEGEENAWKEYWEGKCEELYIWRPHNWAGYRESHTKQEQQNCRSCGRPGKDFVVRANGDISVCCLDFNREMSIGNLYENSFEDIYEGEILKKIVDMHKNKSFFEYENICQHCDQLYDRTDALLYSSNINFKIGSKTTADN
ncbi:MAG: SPASM domain-containing protein [Lachnospiraceae bacterium]|nr:SPASM domain-containing protein [Lachnospiraceae bacterium]